MDSPNPCRANPVPPPEQPPLVPGTTVTVISFAPSGRPFIEGRAVIVATTNFPHHYRVRFVNEQNSKIRFVHPDLPTDPERALALLTALWEAQNEGPSFDDFFPPDSD